VPTEALSEEQREIRELIRELARERIAPRAAEIDARGEFPWDVKEVLADTGLLGLHVGSFCAAHHVRTRHQKLDVVLRINFRCVHPSKLTSTAPTA
jgi:alkylation response protein AidB-like acyl-CoA dehydrogenase